MTSSRLEPPAYTTGAHRAPRRAPRSESGTDRPPVRYEPYLDGLFTYCLSVLCDHDAATEVLGEVLAISERQYGRCPAGDGERRAWLYALARWACLRRLGERRGSRPGAHAGRREPGAEPGVGARTDVPPEVTARRRRELAMLAWPEAAGTTPEQREALELAVRHRLRARDVAAVLSMEALPARELLNSAACEVERTRAALAVVETGNCPAVARLTGDDQVLLSSALRRELVRHVDDCPRCRRAAERAEAAGPWPGSAASARAARPGAPSLAAASPAVLPLVEAPRAAAYGAMTNTPRSRATTPRFGRDGFPMDPKDRAARRERLRARAVTTTVVATVVAAPVLALWAAYRGAPPAGEGHDGTSVSAGDAERRGAQGAHPYDNYENAGNAENRPGDPFATGSRDPDVSVEVISDGTESPSATPRLSVTAESTGDRTRITLTATGTEPVTWSAWTSASWLRLSRTSGTLTPGRSVTVHVHVDHAREPSGPWRARIGLTPTGSVVAISGYGARPPSSSNPNPNPPPVHPTHPTRPPSSPPPTPTDPGDPTTPTDPPPGTSDPTDPPPSTDPPPPTDPPAPPTEPGGDAGTPPASP
ncbi:BACON domain-containing protein [Streptomyces niveus]|uniref:BACON domain-containing protein n=1 Tax=Streptomyces niveus TaxID=193462 RepID=UPI00386C4806